jgi:H-type lectin domain
LEKEIKPVIFNSSILHKQKFEGVMKKLISVIFVVLFLGSLTITFSQSKFVTGKYSANMNSSGFTLDKNTGERSYSIDINFLDPFESRPEVIATVSLLDADKGANVRYTVETSAISRDGFTIKITTWDNSKIFGIGGNWIAYIK